MSPLTPAQFRFMRDLTVFIELVGRKLKGATSTADNNDCNVRFKDALAIMDRHRKDGELIDIDETCWNSLKEMLERWKQGEDVDEEERFELCDWVTRLKKAGALPPELFPAMAK